MLFNLGLTAHAAAAHESLDDPSPLPSPQLSHPSSPSPITALSSLPAWGSLYTMPTAKKMEPPMSQARALRDLTQSPVESVRSSDGEYSSRISRSHSVRKPSSRPKTSYQLAHPAAHACHRRFKIRPKLLLQLQQVSQTPRPLPILDVLPSTVFLPRLARKFPTIFRGKNGLGPNDLIIVTSDLYDQTVADRSSRLDREDDDDDEHQEVVATICQILNEHDLHKGKAEICLNHGPVWEAMPLPNGSYEFVAHTAHGVRTLRWVLRGPKNRKSAPPGSPVQAESKRFTFSVINPNTRRHPVIASMTRNHLEVFDEYSMPASVSSSVPTSAMSMISDGSDEAPLDRNAIKLDDDLRILIIVTSIWVAFREGWSHNFRYNDAALTLHSKLPSPVASRHTSPTAVKNGPDYFTAENDHPENQSNGRKHRVSMSNVPSSSDRIKSLASGKLAKRSNSTGAAFIERSNRRASGTKGRAQRHSFLPHDTTREVVPNSGRQETTEGHVIAQNRIPEMEGMVRFAAPDSMLEKHRRDASTRKPDASVSRGLNGQSTDSSGAKSKRRHRISGFFDCLLRKTGIH